MLIERIRIKFLLNTSRHFREVESYRNTYFLLSSRTRRISAYINVYQHVHFYGILSDLRSNFSSEPDHRRRIFVLVRSIDPHPKKALCLETVISKNTHSIPFRFYRPVGQAGFKNGKCPRVGRISVTRANDIRFFIPPCLRFNSVAGSYNCVTCDLRSHSSTLRHVISVSAVTASNSISKSSIFVAVVLEVAPIFLVLSNWVTLSSPHYRCNFASTRVVSRSQILQTGVPSRYFNYIFGISTRAGALKPP